MSFFDPAYPESKLSDILYTDVVFVSVPTNQLPNGDCDVDIVEQVIEELNLADYTGLIAIKSTVIPGTTERLSQYFPNLRICCVPEFLRAKTALADFIHNHDLLIIGSHRQDDYELIRRVHGSYPHHVSCVTPTEAEVVKYFNNVHHAMQVTFANIAYEVCDRMGANYMNVYNAITKRDCINRAYLMANKNTRAYGGHCLPKDTTAWNNLLKKLDIDVSLIQSVINDNEKFK
jgi:UDPglucose 6-dehydrogenase